MEGWEMVSERMGIPFGWQAAQSSLVWSRVLSQQGKWIREGKLTCTVRSLVKVEERKQENGGPFGIIGWLLSAVWLGPEDSMRRWVEEWKLSCVVQ